MLKSENCTEDRENLMASLIEILTDLCEAFFIVVLVVGRFFYACVHFYLHDGLHDDG